MLKINFSQAARFFTNFFNMAIYCSESFGNVNYGYLRIFGHHISSPKHEIQFL